MKKNKIYSLTFLLAVFLGLITPHYGFCFPSRMKNVVSQYSRANIYGMRGNRTFSQRIYSSNLRGRGLRQNYFKRSKVKYNSSKNYYIDDSKYYNSSNYSSFDDSSSQPRYGKSLGYEKGFTLSEIEEYRRYLANNR